MLHFRRQFWLHLQLFFRRDAGAPLCLPPCLLLCLGLAACATSSPPSNVDAQLACRYGESRQVQELLYFGTRTPQGFVSKAEWAAFVESSITPKFPKGLTVLAGAGQWQGASGDIVREPSYVLSLIYPDSAAKDRAIAEIIRAYKQRFQQETVLRVRSRVCVSFP